MSLKNTKLIDSDIGVFSFLDILTIQVPPIGWWQSEDFEDEKSRGVIFSAFEPPKNEDEDPVLNIAWFLLADATNDPDELNITLLNEEKLSEVDKQLHQDIENSLKNDGMIIQKWVPSELSEISGIKMLISSYLYTEGNVERQSVAVRFSVKDKNIVIILNYLLSMRDEIAQPIFETLHTIKKMDLIK